jgi:hypothetical protein
MNGQRSAVGVPEDGIAAAAAWWASRLGNCHHDPIGLDAPDKALSVDDMQWVIEMNLQAKRGKYDPGQLERYRAALAEAIWEHLRGCPGAGTCGGRSVGPGRHTIACDYDPDQTLCSGAARAGIELDSLDLPCKTTMLLQADSITVSEGYGGPWMTIWDGRPTGS